MGIFHVGKCCLVSICNNLRIAFTDVTVLGAIPCCLQGTAINKLIPWSLDEQLYLPQHVPSELITMFCNSLRRVLERALSPIP